VAVLPYGLQETGKLKNWTNPASAVQLRLLTHRIGTTGINWTKFSTDVGYHNQPIRSQYDIPLPIFWNDIHKCSKLVFVSQQAKDFRNDRFGIKKARD
jgi:hypothetical protein